MTDLGIPGVGEATMFASGGTALVYEALSSTGERLAVKVLRGIRGDEVSRRFEREQSAAERLADHPSIIKILHSGTTAIGEPYLVMPLIVGGSLNDELERSGAFPLHQASGDIATAAEALEFAHTRGVLHRDIKPGNLLRDEDGSIIVSDFGIARVINAGITSSTVGASTPLYAAPEVLAENQASVRSEVYALGASLYALLAGKPAFSGDQNIWATMNRIRTEVPAPIAGVPMPVMRVIEQAMAKDPLDRPPSAAQFRENLRQALTSPDNWTPPAPTLDLAQAAADPRPATPAIDTNVAPPAPAFDKPAPVMGRAIPVTQPRPAIQPLPASEGTPFFEQARGKLLAAIVAIALLGGFAWWGQSRLFPGDGLTPASALPPPVDNSLPSPSVSGDNQPSADDETSTDEAEQPDADGGVAIDDLPDDDLEPSSLVRFAGAHFTALLPEGWTVSGSDIDVGYGFRSMFETGDMYLNIDTTPKEQQAPGSDIAEDARNIAAGIASASEVRTEEVEGLTMHSFTFRNSQGVDSIDIFFEVDGDGYAVVAGSTSDPDTVFATARLVALSVRSTPDA